MRLNDKLYKLRKEKGLTQSDLADKLGVSRQSVSNWEVGSVVPSTKRLKDLSHLYEVPLDHLLDENSVEDQVDGLPEGVTLSEAEETGTVAEPISERTEKRHKRLWIAVAAVLGVVLLALSVAAVVHKVNDKSGGDKAVLLNELSNREVKSEAESEFDFS